MYGECLDFLEYRSAHLDLIAVFRQEFYEILRASSTERRGFYAYLTSAIVCSII